MSLSRLIEMYQDTPEAHQAVWDTCVQGTNSTSWLKGHRDFVEEGQYGYGERAFHYLWKCVIETLPDNFRFLEIGVFQGQSLSLAQLIAKKVGKTGEFYGISPLDKTGDLTLDHPDIDYLKRINEMHVNFDLRFPKICKGLSFDPRIQELFKEKYHSLDLLFVDGCHDYEVAVDDIEVYGKLVKVGGYLLVDDASNDLKIPDGMIKDNWVGIPSVTRAVQKTLSNNPDWEMPLAVGHQKLWRRVK